MNQILIFFMLIQQQFTMIFTYMTPFHDINHMIKRNDLQRKQQSFVNNNNDGKFMSKLYSISKPTTTQRRTRKELSDLRDVLLQTTLVLSTTISLKPTIQTVNAISLVPTEDDYIHALSILIVTKKILEPVEKYIQDAVYDAARTNVNYCLNFLQLQKSVETVLKGSIEYAEDSDMIEKSSEASQRLTNTAVQLDSTIYTCVFIPSEDGEVTPTQEKYRKQSYGFLKDLNNDLDTMISLATEKQLSTAKTQAEKTISSLPSNLFKSTSKAKETLGKSAN